MTVGQLKDFADTGACRTRRAPAPMRRSPSTIRASARSWGTIVADGPHSFNFYPVGGGKFWFKNDVLDWLVDNFSFHLHRNPAVGKSSEQSKCRR